MKNKEKLEKLMNHPVFLGYDGSAKLIRGQLFFLAVAVIFIITLEIEIAEGSAILGVRLSGLTTERVLIISFVLLVYQTMHFIWVSWEAFAEWRIRQTALSTASWGGAGLTITSTDHAQKVRQTTLYAYLWDILEPDLCRLRVSADGQEVDGYVKQVKKAADDIKRVLDAEQVRDALWRFDNWMKMFFKVQNYRWFFLEFMLPLMLAVTAIIMIIYDVYCSG